jgi:hypothetical protein
LKVVPFRLGGMADEKYNIEPRISFSHARTKPVVVENTKRRTAPRSVGPVVGR